jgi:16S rRNA (adenine1518-N6/adenine1519-N6)-dimethyltransferase
VADAGVGPGDRVLEIGAGFGSITVALAEAGCEVLALELDRRIAPALAEVVAPYPAVRVERVDAMRADWDRLLGSGPWSMVSNLPYNISVPLMVRLLESVPAIERYLVMVQREVGDRLVAAPGAEAYGTVSVRIAYRAEAELVRRVPAAIFWPRPNVDSVLVRFTPHPPPVDVPVAALFRVVEEGFAERRKTMANALRRLGVDREGAGRVLREAGVASDARAEDLGLETFAGIVRSRASAGWRP